MCEKPSVFLEQRKEAANECRDQITAFLHAMLRTPQQCGAWGCDAVRFTFLRQQIGWEAVRLDWDYQQSASRECRWESVMTGTGAQH